MNSTVRYIGLDVHKETIVIAVADSGREAATVFKTVIHDVTRLKKELSILARGDRRLQICYEAGPTGFGLQRALQEAGYSCLVVAPSLVPQKAGVRVKTDRRDACKLAQHLRAGDLVGIWVPDESTEALRDLERARDDAKNAERVARQHLGKFLLRHGKVYTQGTSWTQRHLAWIRQQTFSQPAHQRVLADYLQAVMAADQRVRQLNKDIEELVQTSTVAPLIQSFQALRGISLISATVIAAEIGDLRRFPTARQFMSFVGLVPSEQSSGQTICRGPLTRTGNGHVRRILIEAAWQYQHLPAVTAALRKRQEGLSDEVKRISWGAQRRLHNRLRHLQQRRVSANKAIAAVARELAGFVWAVAHATPVTTAV